MYLLGAAANATATTTQLRLRLRIERSDPGIRIQTSNLHRLWSNTVDRVK